MSLIGQIFLLGSPCKAIIKPMGKTIIKLPRLIYGTNYHKTCEADAGINFIQNHPLPGQTPGTRLEGSKNPPSGTVIVYKNLPSGQNRESKTLPSGQNRESKTLPSGQNRESKTHPRDRRLENFTNISMNSDTI